MTFADRDVFQKSAPAKGLRHRRYDRQPHFAECDHSRSPFRSMRRRGVSRHVRRGHHPEGVGAGGSPGGRHRRYGCGRRRPLRERPSAAMSTAMRRLPVPARLAEIVDRQPGRFLRLRTGRFVLRISGPAGWRQCALCRCVRAGDRQSAGLCRGAGRASSSSCWRRSLCCW